MEIQSKSLSPNTRNFALLVKEHLYLNSKLLCKQGTLDCNGKLAKIILGKTRFCYFIH